MWGDVGRYGEIAHLVGALIKLIARLNHGGGGEVTDVCIGSAVWRDADTSAGGMREGTCAEVSSSL